MIFKYTDPITHEELGVRVNRKNKRKTRKNKKFFNYTFSNLKCILL